jgi:hypothetical protein
MTYRFIDKFDRTDGGIGTNYTVACGGVQISDEAVIPIDATQIVSGVSPILPDDVTAQKTQVFYTNETMNGPDYVVRTMWSHDGADASSLPSGVTQPPSFSSLARMTKDPVLYDLGVEEDPSCYDQGYGARVTFPLDGSAPILKIIKFMPLKRLPGSSRPSSTEVDGMVVLAQVTLGPDDLNLDPNFDVSNYTVGDILPYKGFWQDMRLRIRRQDNEVILEVYLNDRNLNQAKLTHTDRQDPLWGIIGLPGFEFLSATLAAQPAGVSPFSLAGLSLLRCGLFSVATFSDVRRPVRVTPGSFYTYREVVNRTILLVEKNGDAKYTATTGGQTKFDTYLRFVVEAESDILRKEGYFDWIRRSSKIYLADEVDIYELPEDLGEIEYVRPGNWNNPPLMGMTSWDFHQRLGGVDRSNGRPTIYTTAETGPNSRKQIRLFPVPADGSIATVPSDEEDPHIIVEYFARQIYPDEPDIQIPLIPQEHVDVLTYGAAAHAMLLDTDDANAQRFAGVYQSKLRDLRRANNRKVAGEHTIARSAGDVIRPDARSRIPLLRSTQLESFVLF